MLVEEMDIFFHQVLKKMSDTYLRSTSNNDVAKFISEFSEKFEDKVQLGKKKK